jgi:hypothetical protein
MPDKKKTHEKLTCPECSQPFDVRSIKNHVMSKHDYTRDQSDALFRNLTGRESTSWKQMSRNREKTSGYIHRETLPPMQGDNSDLVPSDGMAWFQKGFAMGLAEGKKLKE